MASWMWTAGSSALPAYRSQDTPKLARSASWLSWFSRT